MFTTATSEELKEIFERIDDNDDGSVSFPEFRSLMHEVGDLRGEGCQRVPAVGERPKIDRAAGERHRDGVAAGRRVQRHGRIIGLAFELERCRRRAGKRWRLIKRYQ